MNATESYTIGSTTESFTMTSFWLYVSFILTEDDLCELKSRELLAVSDNSTYLENTINLIEDMYGNDASIHDASNRLMAGSFTNDTTRPNLIAFEIDLENKLLTLISNEPIYLPSIQPTYLTLQSKSNISDPDSSNFTLTSGTAFYSNPEMYLKKRVSIMMTPEDLHVIQLDEELAENMDNSYLSILDGVFQDMFLNDVYNISNEIALNAINHETDNIGPELLSYTLDMDLGIMDFTFSDVVLRTSFTPTSVTLQNAANPLNVTASYTLSDSATNSPDGYIMRIYLGERDFNTIKYIRTLATMENNTFLVTDDDPANPPFFMDSFNNRVMDITTGLIVANFTEDESSPNLVEFDLSMNEGFLRLTFNETVMASSLNITNLILGSSENFTTADHVFNISDGSSSQNDSTVLIVYFSIDDLNKLKRITPGIATSTMDTYLAFDNTTLVDMNMNLVVEIDIELALDATGFDPDRTNPSLDSFNLNLTTETLELTFDETVDATTFDVTGITLVSTRNATTATSYTLKAGSHTLDNSTFITVQLDIDDLNEIKRLRELAVSDDTTYIAIRRRLVKDMNDNNVNNNTLSSALGVTEFGMDTVNPVLASFDLNLNLDLLSLTFVETIRADSLNITYLTLINGINMFGNETQYTLTGGEPTTVDSTVLNITLNKVDSDLIRFHDNLATNNNDTYLILNNYTIQDMNANPISYTILPVSNFTADGVNPTFILFDLDINTGILSLSFSETVDVSTLNTTQITIQDNSHRSLSTSRHMLTGGYSLYDDNTTVYVQLSDDDLNELKRQQPLITGDNYTYISLTDYTIRDMNGNLLMPVEASAAEKVNFTIPDTTSPKLLYFDLNMDTGELTLTFSETVDTTSFNSTAYTLLANQTDNLSSLEHYQFTTNSYTASKNGTIVTLSIGVDDLNAIKQLTRLATGKDTTYISITTDAISDMFGNKVDEINTSFAINVTNYTIDVTYPVLSQFQLIMNDYQLILSFSETVNASSLNISGISLHPEQDPMSLLHSYRLSSENTITDSPSGPEIIVQISTEDMNAIKYINELATSEDNTYITIDSTTIMDMVGLTVTPITIMNATRAAVYMRDTMPPVLQNFTLNLTSEILSLTFNETVNATSINLNSIELHNSNSSISQIDFAGSEIISDNSNIIDIEIDTEILHVIKLMLNLATNDSNTYLQLLTDSVLDLSNTDQLPANGITNVRIATEELYPDKTSPQLDNFVIDLSNGTIRLNFDEPVLAQSLNIPAISLQSTANLSNIGTDYTLTEGYSNSTNGLSILIFIDDNDLNNIKQNEQLLRSNSTTFIRFTENLITDMNNNPVIPIVASDAEMTIRFLDDTVRPRLISFAIDMDNGMLTLMFDETMNVSTLSFTDITLQLLTAVTNPEHRYTLTDGSLASTVDDTSVLVQITDFDLNEIKRRQIASSEMLVALTTTNTLIQDMVGQYAIPLLNNMTAIGTDDYIPDEMHLQLQMYDLDLNEETLILFFSEAVDTDTLDLTQITLYNTDNITNLPMDNIYTLTNTSDIIPTDNATIGRFTGSDSRIVVIQLSREDLNEIKRRQGLAVTERTIYLGITNTTITDTVGNPVVPISSERALMARAYRRDRVKPVLDSFDLNLSTNELILTFSETVFAVSYNASAYTLYNANSTVDSNYHTLTGGTLLTMTNDPVITIQLDEYDVNKITNITDLATSEYDTFLDITEYGIFDMNMNILDPTMLPVQVNNYTEDLVDPQIRSYTLDLNTGIISFRFSETINVTTLDITEVWIQNAENVSDITSSYRIMNGTILTPNGPQVSVQLSEDDQNMIKQLYDLATAESNTWLYHTVNFTSDMADNPVALIPDTEALQVARLIPDQTQPRLEMFDFDANTGMMTLLFSETINVDSFMPSAITLQADETATLDGRYYRLTGGYPVDENSTTIVFNLTVTDFNQIKRIPSLAISNSTLYLIHDDILIEDMNSNLAVPIRLPNGLRVSGFTPDLSNAILMLVELDLSSGLGVLRLTFDETVNRSTLNISQLMLQNNASDPTITLPLTGGDIPEINSNVIEITLSFEDSSDLKRLELCKRGNNGSD